MNNYDLAGGTRARQTRNQGIPDYDYVDYRQHYAPQSQGPYYVEDDSHLVEPLSPPRSHYARPDYNDTRRAPPPARPPRPDQYEHEYERTASPQQRRHDMYQQFFQAGAAHHGNGQWNGSGYTAPGAQSYPPPKNLHALINQLQKRAPLGPPPSARRGPPSYYQQDVPVVHPIVEEADSVKGSTRHGSVRSASSMNANGLAAQQHFDDGSSSIYSGVPSMPPPAHISRPEEDIPTTPGILRTDSPQRESPLRQASFGMKTRPVITTVKSSDKLKKDTLSPETSTRRFPMLGLGQHEEQSTADISDNDTPENRRPKLYPRSLGASSDALGALSVHMDSNASDSDLTDSKSERRPKTPKSSRSKPPALPLAFRNDRKEDEDVITPLTPSAKFRDGRKRPPNLNIEAVREAEQRGSLTSLPDLIKRATKLASNLDRGKTASRMGMSAWLGDSEKGSDHGSEKLKMQNTSSNNVRRSAGSLTDMLASFPPPAMGTPPRTRDGHGRKHSFNPWASGLRHSILLPSDSDLGKEHKSQQRKKKRCCGLPLWAIVLLFVLGICLIAAAVIIPVVLVVVPQQRNSQVVANTTSICQQKYTCQNGGSSIVSTSGNCQCLCINGFTGTTCNDQDRSGCYTVTLGTAANVTVGSAIPRIISDAQANFSIPLDSSALLGLFSSSSLSCTSENALITFNGLAQRDILPRQGTTGTTTADGSATTNGIVYASGSPTTATTMSTVTSSAPAATSSSATGQMSSVTMDFARTVVLFMLQSTGQLSSAIAAQQNLQNFFSAQSGTLASANSLGLGSGYTADLSTFQVTLANGTTVGGGTGHK